MISWSYGVKFLTSCASPARNPARAAARVKDQQRNCAAAEGEQVMRKARASTSESGSRH